MADNYTAKMNDLMQHAYEMADKMDAQGVGANIPFVKEEEGLRGALKTDILTFLFRIMDKEKPVNKACRDYINECMSYDFGEITIELARKRFYDSNLPAISVLLPYFILIDKQLGGNDVSSVYIQTISYIALGILKEQEKTSLEDVVRYYRLTTGCIRMVERALGKKVDFDPLGPIANDKMDVIKAAIEVDQLIHPNEDPAVLAIEEALQKITSGAGDKETATEHTEEPTIELVKDAGDGSELPDATEGTIGEDEGWKELTLELYDTEGETNDEAGKPERISGVEELNSLIGLYEVKQQVKSLVNVLQIRQRCRQMNIKRPAITLHMVFTGNPGTGKTSVARILGKLYKETGLLSKGHLVEVGRADLVGKYVGHTAVMVKEVFEKAKGGVLFIDEAYSLTNEDGGGFGQEAVETLLKLMEDDRDDIAVIVAGYPMLMQEFLDSNPGFRSRFPFVIQFPDYSGAELTEIFECFCRENDIDPSYSILQAVRAHFDKETKRKARNYANARAVRNYFEQMIMNQANRLVEAGSYGREELCEFTIADLPRDRIFSRPTDQQTRFSVVG